MSEEDSDSEATFDYIVVGGGIAGVSCVDMLSQILYERDHKILLISPSQRVKAITNVFNVTPRLASFEVDEVPSTDHFSTKNVQFLQDLVDTVIPEEKVIVTEASRRLKYLHGLCLCHGAAPKLIEGQNILGLRDVESVKKLQERMRGVQRVVIVGNGGIATELAHELQDVEVIWAVKDDSLSTAFVDAGAGQFFLQELNKTHKEVKTLTKRMRYSLAGEDAKKSAVAGVALGPDWHEGLNVSGACSGGKLVRVEFGCEVMQVLESESLLNKPLKSFDDSRGPHEKDKNRTWKTYVELTNGNIFGCDFVISATGVVPNGRKIKCLQNFSLTDDGAVRVDHRLRTGVKGVYAAGDVCQMRLWTQAWQMGLYSARCMTSDAEEARATSTDVTEEKLSQRSGENRGSSKLVTAQSASDIEDRKPAEEGHVSLEDVDPSLEQSPDFCFEMFAHVTRFFGFKVVLLGLFNGQGLQGDYEAVVRVTEGVEYIKCVLKDGKVKGAILIGETDLEETFENLILNQTDVGHLGEELLNPDVDIEDYFD